MKVYFLSTGRCGTTFIHSFFSNYFPEINLEHQKRYSRLINLVSNYPLPEKVKHDFYSYIFRALRNEKVPESSCDPLISLALVNYLNKLELKSYKFILLVRNPLDFVESFMNWKETDFRKKALHHLIPFWQPVGFFHGLSLSEWMNLKKYERFAWVWNYKNSIFFDFVKSNGGMVMKLEDISQDITNINKIVEYLHLNPKPVYKTANISRNRSQEMGYKNSARKIKNIHNICSNMMEKLGY